MPFLQLCAILTLDLCFTGLILMCNAVPGELSSKFTTSENHTYGSSYVMQTSKFIILQIMRYGKIVLKVLKISPY